MKILFVATELPKASGITTFVENVSAELRAAGHEVVVRGLDEVEKRGVGVEWRVEDFDVVHLHGLWRPMLHKIASAVYRLSLNTYHSASAAKRPRLVWSPHGMLQKWALKNKWWKKIPALALYQWWDLRRADVIHVTAASEVEDVRRLGLGNEVVVAPLGVRLNNAGACGTRRIRPDLNAYAPSASQPDGISTSGLVVSPQRTLLFVSRVQRKKGLPNLIEAWARLPDELKKGWRVRIVGPDEDGHTVELMRLCEALGLTYVDQNGKLHSSTSTLNFNSKQPQVEFVGPKYDADLDAEYSNADLFVLPTHSENFGSVVIEALAHEVPVICTKEAPWAELEGGLSGSERCGWWIDDNVDALTDCLCTALATPSDVLRAMGTCGRRLVEEKYTWEAVARKMIEAYGRII